jgi:hypothetical protein
MHLPLMFWVSAAQWARSLRTREQCCRTLLKGQKAFDVTIVNLTKEQKAIDSDRDFVRAREHLVALVKSITPIMPHRIKVRLVRSKSLRKVRDSRRDF